MPTLRRRGGATALLNPWPGYVDALSTLLMVLVFVLLVFVLAQAFLSVALSGRDQALDRLGRQVAELADMLSLEKGRTVDLSASVARLTQDLQAARAARDSAAAAAAGLHDALAQTQGARDAAVASGAALQARVSDQAVELESAQKRLAAAQARYSETAEKASSENLARLADQVRALLALRAQLAAQLKDATDANTALTAKLRDSSHLADSAQAQVALLSQQLDALRAQLAEVAAALDLARRDSRAKDVRIADLGARLNEALVSKVAELQRYRSEFFGRLRDVLAGRPGITVVGDRFVFQSEVLFPPGSADLSGAGAEQMRKLAATLKELAPKIPADVPWVLRVDGHADRQAVRGRFASNWELSAERAINVVRLLAANGVPANRLAAAGFGEFQPIDPGATPAAFSKNRRIELRLTDR